MMRGRDRASRVGWKQQRSRESRGGEEEATRETGLKVGGLEC